MILAELTEKIEDTYEKMFPDQAYLCNNCFIEALKAYAVINMRDWYDLTKLNHNCWKNSQEKGDKNVRRISEI